MDIFHAILGTTTALLAIHAVTTAPLHRKVNRLQVDMAETSSRFVTHDQLHTALEILRTEITRLADAQDETNATILRLVSERVGREG